MIGIKDPHYGTIFNDTAILLDVAESCFVTKGKGRRDNNALASMRRWTAIRAIGNLICLEGDSDCIRDLRWRLTKPVFHKFLLNYGDYVVGGDNITVSWWIAFRAEAKKPPAERRYKY